MSTDDKFGIGAGLLALGLAAGVILLGQLTYDEKMQAELEKPAAAPADSGKAPQAESTEPAEKPTLLYRLIPHRALAKPEAIFDGIVCALALPAGICFFVLGTLSGSKDRKPDENP